MSRVCCLTVIYHLGLGQEEGDVEGSTWELLGCELSTTKEIS